MNDKGKRAADNRRATGRLEVPRLANFFWYLAYEVPAHSDVLSIRLPSRIHKEVYFRDMLLSLIANNIFVCPSMSNGIAQATEKEGFGTGSC